VELEKVVTIVDQHLEGPVNEAVIQEFVKQEALVKQLEPSSRLLR
jgi:hypothetical protein